MFDFQSNAGGNVVYTQTTVGGQAFAYPQQSVIGGQQVVLAQQPAVLGQPAQPVMVAQGMNYDTCNFRPNLLKTKHV